MNSSAILYALKNTRLFSDLSEEVLVFFAKHAHSKHYKKDSIIFLHGDEADSFYIIVQGWVKLFRETMDGKESIISLISTHETLGESTIFEDAEHHFSAQTIQDTTLLVIPTSLVRKKILEDSKLALKLLSNIAKYTSQLELQVEQLTVMTTSQRLGCFLLKLCHDHDENTIETSFPCDKSLVASWLGMKPETFSRSLQQLKQYDVHIDGTKITIDDIEKLRDFSCNACSNPGDCTPDSLANCSKSGCHKH